tara:strand:+ start:337 stop:501 length:165 start_codon:yes stop_codon:yes gene_type:complete
MNYIDIRKQGEIARRKLEAEANKHKKTSEQLADDVAEWEKTHTIEQFTPAGDKL